jgi:hypothetical protein
MTTDAFLNSMNATKLHRTFIEVELDPQCIERMMTRMYEQLELEDFKEEDILKIISLLRSRVYLCAAA